MIFLAVLILIISLTIASIAGYFSVLGLSLLFVGSSTAVIVMGAALEVGKLVAVSVLHQLWDKLGWMLKTYLFVASFLLMVITSLGIYGFLSNGYNATSFKVKELERQIQNNDIKIVSLNDEIFKLQNYDYTLKTVKDDQFNEQQLQLIDKKEQRISNVQDSIEVSKKKALEELSNAKIILDTEINKEVAQIELFNNRLKILDEEVQTWLNQGTGNLFKQNGLEKARLVKESQQKERDDIDAQIKEVQQRIQTLRDEYNVTKNSITDNLEKQIQTSESLIKSIQEEIVNDKKVIVENQQSVQLKIDNEIARIQTTKEANKNEIEAKQEKINSLYDNNLELNQKINETDVGTFKFVAKNFNLELDKTVNWFIMLIISVFDPLAVALLLCFNYLVKKPPTEKKIKPTIKEKIISEPVIEKEIKKETTTTLTTPVSSDDDEDWYPFVHEEQGKMSYKSFPQPEEFKS